jgi:hypothetical protein
VSLGAKPSASSPSESALSCDSALRMRLLAGHWLWGVLDSVRDSCSPESRLNRVIVRSMRLLLPPTKMPLSPARSTTMPRTCQKFPFRASPRFSVSSLCAEKFRIGVSPGLANRFLRAPEVPLLPCAIVTVCARP